MSRLSDTLAPLRQRWQALAPRERGLLGSATVLVLVAALWLGPGRWAWKTLRTGPALEAQARQQLQDMQGLAQRIRQAPPGGAEATTPPPEQLLRALEASRGPLQAQLSLQVQGDQVLVQVRDLDGPALQTWLGEVRRASRVRVVELELQRSATGSAWQGRLVLAASGPAP